MKRCNKPAFAYSWFNGFRACDECIEAGEPHEFDSMIVTPKEVGPCDKPVESREEFFARDHTESLPPGAKHALPRGHPDKY